MVAVVAFLGIVLSGGCVDPSRKGAAMIEPGFESPNVRGAEQENAEMPHRSSQEASPASSIREEHRARLMAIDGVEGVGVGQNQIGDEAIVVYVRDQEVAKQVPRELDGISVQVQVTGPIDALKLK
jgi:hypothetical protein